MTIQAYQVTVQPAVTKTITAVDYETRDDRTWKGKDETPGRLIVTFKNLPGVNKPPFEPIEVKGADYAALGQWTDATLDAWICTKLGLTATQS